MKVITMESSAFRSLTEQIAEIAAHVRAASGDKKAYVHIEDWRNRPLQGGRYPYVYVDGIYLRLSLIHISYGSP